MIDLETQAVHNIPTRLASGDQPQSSAQRVYVPHDGTDGILVALRGSYMEPGTQQASDIGTLASMYEVLIFNIGSYRRGGNGTWYKQKTAGPTPRSCVDNCAVCVSAPANSRTQISVHVGREVTEKDAEWLLGKDSGWICEKDGDWICGKDAAGASTSGSHSYRFSVRTANSVPAELPSPELERHLQRCEAASPRSHSSCTVSSEYGGWELQDVSGLVIVRPPCAHVRPSVDWRQRGCVSPVNEDVVSPRTSTVTGQGDFLRMAHGHDCCTWPATVFLGIWQHFKASPSK